MADAGDLGDLRGLYQDLTFLSQNPLANIDRLHVELQARIDDFKKLLDKPPKNNASRQAILSGKIEVDSVEYTINQDFQQDTLQLADALNLDEIQAAKYYLAAQEDALRLDRPPLITAIMQFHERRDFLLECLRLILREPSDREREEMQEVTRYAVASILETNGAPLRNGSLYTRKCMDAMLDIEKWLVLLGEQLQKASIVGEPEDSDILEAIEFQRHSLERQHESLGAIVCYLFRANYTAQEDFRILLDRLKKRDRFDMVLVHYIPPLVSAINQYGSADNRRDARSLHEAIVASKESSTWSLPTFHSAVIAIWLAVYSGMYLDAGSASPLQGVDLQRESEERTSLFMNVLDDGALEFILSICASISKDEWHDPARNELVSLLLKDSTLSTLETEPASNFLQPLVMESLETFAESCVANMPDAVRMLKTEEDLQRLNQITALQEGLASNLHRGLVETRTHLESFLVMMAFIFEHRIDTAKDFFWSDSDGHLYGFLQWASKRQTVPRVSAFCELLIALSEGEENANSAHQFLLEEDKMVSAKLRRSASMNWAQMFSELQLYATKVTEKPSATSQAPVLRIRRSDIAEMNEPESPVMLSCYLRLIGHLCKESIMVREWMLQRTDFNLVSTVLKLCSGPIPTHLRASAFATLNALMKDKSSSRGNDLWVAIDQWVSGTAANSSSLAKLPLVPNIPVWHDHHVLQDIAESFDQTNAFVGLLQTMISPPTDSAGFNLSLPFPESLGAYYRMPGVEPYVDFVLGQAFAKKATELSDARARLVRYNCLNFAVTCLETFNENLVTLANQQAIPVDSSLRSSLLTNYVRLHPFARVMEWLFNEEVLESLFAASHHDITDLSKASTDSVLVLSVLRSIDVINLVLEMQSTYLDVVRPSVKSHSAGKSTNVANSSLASFEDSILNHLELVSDLCLYCGTGHEQLTLTSLAVLEKLSSSRKLNKTSSSAFAQWRSTNKVVEILNTNLESDRLSRSLASQMEVDIRELERSPEAPGYLIKDGLLSLLNSCLGTVADRPNVAHLLLGFACLGNSLDVAENSLLDNQLSLLHAIIHLVGQYPEGIDNSIVSWMIHLKRSALQVLRHLWTSRLSSVHVLRELRVARMLFFLFSQQYLVGSETLWDLFPVSKDSEDKFWNSKSTDGMAEYLWYRSMIYDYATTEIRAAAKLGSTALQADILSTLLGKSVLETGETISHGSIFDLFDFADLQVAIDFPRPKLDTLEHINYDAYTKTQILSGEPLILYDVAAIEELLQLTKADLPKTGGGRPYDEEQVLKEIRKILVFVDCNNQSKRIRFNRFLALRSWAELAATMVLTCQMDHARKTTFILHMLQIILPKLEAYIAESAPEAIELARLVETLTEKLDWKSDSPQSKRGGEIIIERTFQVFQACIRGIPFAINSIDLRETFYNICSRYLSRITANSTAQNFRQHSQGAIKTAGPSLIESICDDAYAGQESCRLSALLFLNTLAVLDRQENASLIVKWVSQSNYLAMFIDVVRAIPVEFQNTEPENTPLLFSYYEVLLSFLQQLAQTKVGAAQVLHAGLFSAIKESQLLAVDPDIGLDIDNPDALQKYYVLLLSVIRVIVSAVIARGLHNEQIIEQTRIFLTENRHHVVGMFKKHAKIGGGAPNGTTEALDEMVKSYVALITAAGFIEFEDKDVQQIYGPKVFS